MGIPMSLVKYSASSRRRRWVKPPSKKCMPVLVTATVALMMTYGGSKHLNDYNNKEHSGIDYTSQYLEQLDD